MVLRSLHLVRRMQDLLAQPHSAEQFPHLEKRVLAILPRHRQPTRECRPPTALPGKPIVQDEPLPRIGLETVVTAELRRQIPEGLISRRCDVPSWPLTFDGSRALPGSQGDQSSLPLPVRRENRVPRAPRASAPPGVPAYPGVTPRSTREEPTGAMPAPTYDRS